MKCQSVVGHSDSAPLEAGVINVVTSIFHFVMRSLINQGAIEGCTLLLRSYYKLANCLGNVNLSGQ